MSDYLIDFQAAIEAMSHISDCICEAEAVDALCELPAVDAVPVKHGKWIPTCEFHGFNNEVRNKAIACSVCNVAFRLRDYSLMEDYRYCPNCGARMDAE